jgi:hypothetical protein
MGFLPLASLKLVTDALSDPEVIKKAVIGVTGAVVPKVAASLYGYFANARFARKNFTIAGYWVAEFQSYVTARHNIELVRFAQDRERVHFVLQQYSTAHDPKTFRGEGIFRGSALSAVYYAADAASPESGVFSLFFSQSPRVKLSGKYAELSIEGVAEGIVTGQVDYSLRRVPLPCWRRVKMMFGRNCYRNYGEAKEAISKLAS